MKLALETKEKQKLIQLVNKKNKLSFLGYTVNLETCEVWDDLNNNMLIEERTLWVLNTLLFHYNKADLRQQNSIFIKFRELPGGQAYEAAFVKRASDPIATVFGDKPVALIEAATLINGTVLNFGDSSVAIPALPRIQIVYILWQSGEFPASTTTLFDETAKHYLPTEDLAVLAELTTHRIIAAWSLQKSKNK